MAVRSVTAVVASQQVDARIPQWGRSRQVAQNRAPAQLIALPLPVRVGPLEVCGLSGASRVRSASTNLHNSSFNMLARPDQLPPASFDLPSSSSPCRNAARPGMTPGPRLRRQWTRRLRSARRAEVGEHDAEVKQVHGSVPVQVTSKRRSATRPELAQNHGEVQQVHRVVGVRVAVRQ